MDDEVGVASDPCSAIGSRNAKHTGNTETLYMCGKNIGWLEGFDKFPNLKYLWLSRNKLRRLDGLEANFRIHCLYAGHNRVASLEGSSVARLLHVEELILNDNRLEDLKTHVDILQRLRRLKRLDLYNNPLAEETSYRLHVIKAMPWLEVLDQMKITPEERAKAKKVRRASFDLGAAAASAAEAPPGDRRPSSDSRADRPPDRTSLDSAPGDVPALTMAPPGVDDVMGAVKRRIREKRILLRPHWAEVDRRRLGYVSGELFKSVLVRYALWPDVGGGELLEKYAFAEKRSRPNRELASSKAVPTTTTASGGARVDYLRFCRDVEPSGNQGRDVLIREAILASSWREPIPDVSVCARLAQARARKIEARVAAEEEAARVKMLQQNKEGLAAPRGSTPGEPGTFAEKRQYRKCLDTFAQFVAPDVAGAPVANTARGRASYDRGAPADSLSRRARPPPVPHVRTFQL